MECYNRKGNNGGVYGESVGSYGGSLGCYKWEGAQWGGSMGGPQGAMGVLWGKEWGVRTDVHRSIWWLYGML